MHGLWERIVHWHHLNCSHEPKWLELLEIRMATVAELDTKLDTIQAGVNDLKAQIAALKNQPPAAATQEQVDAENAKADAIVASITA